ncbi:MAG: N-6 DNA methylase, partial [Candidatus Heimdallarchaeota archaeon]|nr:N-6 DNA methylase [Candidatus Heimdallarchaeota archaeon]
MTFGLKTKKLGQYYTPSSIVSFIVENTIGSLLNSKDVHSSTEITILDPSVGRGAFLIGARKYLEAFQKQERAGIENFSSEIGQKIVVNQLYGIDIDSQQVIESRHELGYPKFNGNIKQFDALIPAPDLKEKLNNSSSLLSLRLRYKKAFIRKDLDLITKTESQILEVETKIRERSLRNLKGSNKGVFPLAWEEIFPETGGKFHVIIGNPPWGADITRIKNHLSYLKSATSQMDS